MIFDAIIIGGSYAGLAASLQLARARRSILVVDAGIRRNRFAHSSHGFLTQDGESPETIAATARRQLMAYKTARWLDGTAEAAEAAGGDFQVQVNDGSVHRARRLVLATGVRDILPNIPGLRERWGTSIFHCPYCHGYEINEGEIGVLATSPLSLHQALLLPDWGRVTFFLNGVFTPDADQSAQLRDRGVTVVTDAVTAVEGERATVRTQDGRLFPLDGLFTAPRIEMASSIAHQLGCAFEDGPFGAFIRTDGFKETSVAGVFACGDAARAAGSVSMAVGDGALAGTATHQSIVFRKL